LLKNSLSELYGFDQQVSYQLAFTYIRQLAIHLRNSITTKTQESAAIVYCWQYIHSLDFFSRMLSQHVGTSKNSPLESLVYPVIQVALGAIKLNPSSQYFPLRFQIVESLLRLSRQTGVYIPLAPTLLEPLDSALMKASHSKKADTVLKPVEFEFTLRVSSAYLSGPSSRVYRDQVASKLASLLAQFFELHASNPAFPELVLPAGTIIKKWLRKHGPDCGGKIRHALKGLVEKLEEQSKLVEEKRRGMEFKPQDLHNVQVLNDKEEGALQKWVQKQKTIE
jgi:nucleolar complex protein 2